MKERRTPLHPTPPVPQVTEEPAPRPARTAASYTADPKCQEAAQGIARHLSAQGFTLEEQRQVRKLLGVYIRGELSLDGAPFGGAPVAQPLDQPEP